MTPEFKRIAEYINKKRSKKEEAERKEKGTHGLYVNGKRIGTVVLEQCGELYCPTEVACIGKQLEEVDREESNDGNTT